MTYSHTRYAGDHPDRFPAPQTWLVWIPDHQIAHQPIPNPDFDTNQPADYSKNPEHVYATGVLKASHVGKVRHKNGIEDAKKYVNGFTRSRIGRPDLKRELVPAVVTALRERGFVVEERKKKKEAEDVVVEPGQPAETVETGGSADPGIEEDERIIRKNNDDEGVPLEAEPTRDLGDIQVDF